MHNKNPHLAGRLQLAADYHAKGSKLRIQSSRSKPNLAVATSRTASRILVNGGTAVHVRGASLPLVVHTPTGGVIGRCHAWAIQQMRWMVLNLIQSGTLHVPCQDLCYARQGLSLRRRWMNLRLREKPYVGGYALD